MSVSSQKGKRLELEVAGVLRKKLGARVARDKQSGAGVNKQDIRDYYQDVPFSIECKDHQTFKVKEWMRQAIEAASFNQVPTLVFRSDDEVLACIRFADLVNLAVEIRDLQAQLSDLRAPVVTVHAYDTEPNTLARLVDVGKAVAKATLRGSRTDPHGHITDDFGYCSQKGCKYSRGYKPPKEKL